MCCIRQNWVIHILYFYSVTIYLKYAMFYIWCFFFTLCTFWDWNQNGFNYKVKWNAKTLKHFILKLFQGDEMKIWYLSTLKALTTVFTTFTVMGYYLNSSIYTVMFAKTRQQFQREARRKLKHCKITQELWVIVVYYTVSPVVCKLLNKHTCYCLVQYSKWGMKQK